MPPPRNPRPESVEFGNISRCRITKLHSIYDASRQRGLNPIVLITTSFVGIMHDSVVSNSGNRVCEWKSWFHAYRGGHTSTSMESITRYSRSSPCTGGEPVCLGVWYRVTWHTHKPAGGTKYRGKYVPDRDCSSDDVLSCDYFAISTVHFWADVFLLTTGRCRSTVSANKGDELSHVTSSRGVLYLCSRSCCYKKVPPARRTGRGNVILYCTRQRRRN